MARHLTDRQIGSAGRIVTISSGSALRGMPRGAHYSASKAAVIGFTKSLAQELAPGRTLVNCIAPGTVDTRMPRIDATEEFLAERSRTVVPLGRIGQPADIAEVVAFLVDERVTWLTGQTIWVNGGELLP
jgi:NAD(P)-dependent dehydrogenase (short-subunit alcohol dehydrogenase family)